MGRSPPTASTQPTSTSRLTVSGSTRKTSRWLPRVRPSSKSSSTASSTPTLPVPTKSWHTTSLTWARCSTLRSTASLFTVSATTRPVSRYLTHRTQPTSTRSLTQPTRPPSATLSPHQRASHQLVPISFSSTCLSVSRPTECQMATRTRSTSNVTLSFTFSPNQLRCDCSIKPYSDHIKKHLSFYFPNKM